MSKLNIAYLTLAVALVDSMLTDLLLLAGFAGTDGFFLVPTPSSFLSRLGNTHCGIVIGGRTDQNYTQEHFLFWGTGIMAILTRYQKGQSRFLR